MKNKLTILLFLVCTHVSFAHSDVTFKFTENKGQLNSKVLYHNKLHLGDMFLERDRFTFNMYDPTQLDELYNKRHGADKLSGSELNSANPKINQREDYSPSGEVMRMHAYSMIFQGANDYPKVSATDELSGYTNYSIGKNARKWASMVKSYRMVQYQDLYPGIDLEIYTALKNMKYDFIVAPGANPNDIVIEYDGVESISLLTNGDLLVKLSNGEVKEMNPTSYQEINGQRIEVKSNFKLLGNQLSFEFPDGYDHSKELIIDPVWIFSTLTGSTADNWGFTATYDSQGNLYAAGIAFGTGYPTTVGAHFPSFVGGNFDIAISKFDPTGANLLYSTYLGGSDNEMPHSMVTNSSDQLVLLGSTGSANFPTTTGAYNEFFNGGWAGTAANMWGYNYASGCDISITTFDNSGSIINSTFVGGSDNEGLNEALVYNYADQGRGELVLDDVGNVYVATSLYSSDFPVTDGSVVNGGAGFGFQDAVVFKLNSNLSALNWATYLGGTGSDAGYSVRIAPSGTVYVTGGTTSTDIGADPGSINPAFGGVWDGYIASFNGATGAHLNKTYIGTSEYDQGFIVETDPDGDVYVTGQTLGSYPVFNATYSEANSAQFIHKLSGDLTTSIYSTVFGSGSLSGPPPSHAINIAPTAFLVDNCENVYVSGWGGGFNGASSAGAYNPYAGGSTMGMTVTGDAQQSTTDGSDFYFFVMEQDAAGILYGTYFGDNGTSEHTDGGTSRFDPSGIVYQSVCASCGGSFPTTPGSYATTSGTAGTPYGCNLGAIKFEFDFQGVVNTATSPGDQTLCGSPYNVDFTGGSSPQHEWDFGDGNTSTAANPTHTYADSGTYQVMYVAIDPMLTCGPRDTVYFNINLIIPETFSAVINVPPYDPCTALDSLLVELQFTGSGADSISWDMGDGTIYTDSLSISHYYMTESTYYIEMIAYDFECNLTDTIRDTVRYVSGYTAVTATAPPDQFFCSGPFNMSFSGDVVPDHYWDFGDGTGSSTSQNPMYTYADTGTYTVMYVAIDSSTCNIADTAYFTVQLDQAETFSATIDVPPIDPCNAPDSLLVDIEFTGSGADSLYWNMGDGTTYINDTAVAHYYDTMGTYYIEMIAFDFACNNIDTILDTVEYYADFTTVAATAPPDQFFCSGPFNVSFSGDVVPDHYWDFGDGTGSSTSQNPMYTYADTGTYTVMYVAIDSSTCNIADTAYFTVQLDQAETFSATIDVPPIDPCNAPDSLLVDLEFTGSGADSLYWNMGDGTTYINDTAVAHYYDTMGTYYIEMIAFDFVCNYIDTILDTVEYYADFTTSTAVPPPPQFLCDPPFIVNFDAGTTPPPNAYWDFGDGVGTSTGINPSYTYADTGTYNVLYVAIDSSTCNIADSVYFTVELALTQVFDAQLTVPPIDPCNAPDSLLVEFEFTGTGADSLYWNMGDGTIYINDSLVNHYYDTMGTYYVEMIAFDFVCNRIDTIIDTVEYYANFTTVSATAPPNQMICSAPFDVTFAGDTTPNHYWDFGDGIGTSTAANPIYTYADSGNYTVMYVAIDSSTCNISDTVYFSVDLNLEPALTAVFDLPTVEPCTSPDSLEVTLTFTGAPGSADSLFWDLGDGTTFIDSTTVSHFYTSQGVYVITMEAWDFTCGTYATITDTVDFTVTFSTAIAEASPNILACDPPFDVVFDGGTPPPPMSFWDFDDGTTSTLANPPHTFVDTGHYDIMYVAIDSSTCNIADTLWLTVDILQAEEFSATLDFEPPPPCGTDSITVNLAFTGTGADSLSWDFGDGTIIENSTAVSHVYHDAGIYTISLYAEDTTCNKTEIVNNVLYFYGNPNSEVIVPNVFTPNQDGKNDFILFSGVDPNVEFTWTIFNRWGKPIFETVRPGQAWDGTNMLNGKQLESGLYYYELIYRDQCQNEDKLVTGFIHLLR
ncbi:PKD domain-containing protein [Flavobacteriales bacterium]|nr:PKD domain-containing protein [Flavobacteriales bacterium]